MSLEKKGQFLSKNLEISKPKKLLNLKSVCLKIDKSRASIYNWMNPKSPQFLPNFPRPIRIGKRSIGWLEDEIDNYLTNLANSRDEFRG